MKSLEAENKVKKCGNCFWYSEGFCRWKMIRVMSKMRGCSDYEVIKKNV